MQANPDFFPSLIGAAVLFWIGTKLERHTLGAKAKIALWAASMVLAIPAFWLAAYYTHLFDDAAWFYTVRTLPHSELAGCGLGLLAGIVHSWWQPESLGERAICPAVLLAILLVPFAKPLLDPLDLAQLKDRTEGEVYLQSTFSTCGPASAATLVRSLGAIATERQLAKESFTSRGGTEIWYLSRALRRRGFNTRVLIQNSGDTAMPTSAIAGVRLAGGAGHFIAILAGDRDEFTIADPLKGKLVLSRHELSEDYRFTGFFLVVSRSDSEGRLGISD